MRGFTKTSFFGKSKTQKLKDLMAFFVIYNLKKTPSNNLKFIKILYKIVV